MAWVYLLIAGLLEIGWAIGLKYTNGFTKLWPSVFTVLGMIASFYCLALAVRTLPIGTSYAIWTGIGAAGTAIAGMYLFGDSTAPLRWACIGLIVLGIVGLKLASSH
jgi:quaternary ammonium compound-resistance protein SugE